LQPKAEKAMIAPHKHFPGVNARVEVLFWSNSL